MDTGTARNEAFNLVSAMVLSLVDHSGHVRIDLEPGTECSTIHVTTNPLDTGKVVGKQGRTARSLRTILSGHSKRVGHHFLLNIIETARPPRE